MSNPTNPPVTLAEGFKAQIKYAVAYYDFAVDGVAGSSVGDHFLRHDTIPSNAFVVGYKVIVDTPVTGGAGATVALGTTTSGDLQAAGTLAAGGFNVAGGKASVFTSTAKGNATKVILTVGVNALTAGKFKVLVEYVAFPA